MHGKLQTLDLPVLGPAETKALAYSVLTDAQKKRFEETLELDFSFGIRGLARFRCNVFNQRGAVAAVYRLIPETIRSFNELGLPPVLGDAGRPPARPRAGHRADRQRQVDDAGRDDRQDQHRAARAHPHDRGSDRVHPPAQGLPGQPARGPQRHARVRRTRCAPRCARTPTSSSSARCATSRRSSRRCASPRPATSRSRRCTPTRRRRRSTASSTSSPRTSRGRSARSCRSCSKGSSARRCCRRPTAPAA